MFRKFYVIPALLTLGLFSCNSGADQSAASGSDSTATTVIATPKDSSHGNMDMSSVEPVPDIPAEAKVYFKNLKDGQTVSSPVKIEMGADGIQVDTAGAIKAGSGHHHLLVDAGDSIAAGEVVAKDSTHIHFGKAQKQAELPLSAGKHVLTLQFADGIHRSYGSKLSSSITVNVKK